MEINWDTQVISDWIVIYTKFYEIKIKLSVFIKAESNHVISLNLKCTYYQKMQKTILKKLLFNYKTML